jgi:hypothetical protein
MPIAIGRTKTTGLLKQLSDFDIWAVQFFYIHLPHVMTTGYGSEGPDPYKDN